MCKIAILILSKYQNAYVLIRKMRVNSKNAYVLKVSTWLFCVYVLVISKEECLDVQIVI